MLLRPIGIFEIDAIFGGVSFPPFLGAQLIAGSVPRLRALRLEQRSTLGIA